MKDPDQDATDETGKAHVMFFKRRNDRAAAAVQAGTRYRRRRRDNTIETARVLSIARDSFGIPHVSYELQIEKPSAAARVTDGPRVLALNTFAETFREPVAS